MTSNEVRKNNDDIINNYITSILKDVFKEGYTLGKIDKEILDLDDSLRVKEVFDKKTKQLKELFCYEQVS